jgi:hypothetical protein
MKDIKLYNPIDFLRKEMDIDVIEWKKKLFRQRNNWKGI